MDDDGLLCQWMRPYGVTVAGVLFGCAWWAFVDALCYTAVYHGAGVPYVYIIPGIVCTLALLIMALIGRSEVYQFSTYIDEDVACRARCGLFVAYAMTFGAISASAVLLVLSKQEGEDLWVPAAGVAQCGLISLSGLVLWLTKNDEDSEVYLAL